MRPIDADELLIKLHKEKGYRGICKAILIAIGMPTIEPEVRHGRWVYDETIGGMKHYFCTSCEERDPDNKCFADENQILWFVFCPKCGADMREGGANNG